MLSVLWVSAKRTLLILACIALDYILTVKEIPVGYIEAKVTGDADLDVKRKTSNKEQCNFSVQAICNF